MRGSGRALWVAAAVLAAVSVPAGAVAGRAAGRVLPADMDGGGHGNVDLAVRQVTVSPVRAHPGDVVHVEVVIESKADGSATTTAELLVNGKTVGRQLFTWGMSPGPQLYRLSFAWPTGGVSPGKYRIGARAFVWEDSSPFDNELEVKQPVVIAPTGGGFPGGEPAGGSVTETDPRFVDRSHREGAEPKGEAGPPTGGY
jgi:hypothetical protein